MVFKNLFKNPMLAIGILFMTIFILNSTNKGFFGRREKLIPTSCKAVLVKLNRRIPKNWSTHCKGNNLQVEINYQFPVEEKNMKGKEKQASRAGLEALKLKTYREIANSLMHISKNSPSDNLERTDVVTIKFISGDDILVNALTFGDKLSKLAQMKEPKLIATHIQATVKVQEVKFPGKPDK